MIGGEDGMNRSYVFISKRCLRTHNVHVDDCRDISGLYSLHEGSRYMGGRDDPGGDDQW